MTLFLSEMRPAILPRENCTSAGNKKKKCLSYQKVLNYIKSYN